MLTFFIQVVTLPNSFSSPLTNSPQTQGGFMLIEYCKRILTSFWYVIVYYGRLWCTSAPLHM